MSLQEATFGAGCFWHIEEAFRGVKGVQSTAVGFMGGTVSSPSYEQVCTGKTGHAEVVQVVYDPNEVSYEELLALFWKIHDPTTLNQQGPDIGEQYRSVVFFHTPEQEKTARQSKEKLTGTGRPIVTQIVPASPFWRAEEYHQQYLRKQGLKTCP